MLQQHSIAFGPNQFGSWGFDAKGGERQQILDSLANYGIPVHTIEEHVENLSARYSVERQELGNYCFLQLFIEGDWLALNPMTREWDLLEQQRSAALVREGSILCNENIGQVRYFWFKGFTTNREPKLIPLQERAAWNIASKYFNKRTIYWVENKQSQIGSISLMSLGYLPQDIFTALVKLNPFKDHIDKLLVFQSCDIDLVQIILSYINIDLVKAEAIIKLATDADQFHGTPLLSLSEVPQHQIITLCKLISQITGIETSIQGNSIQGTINGKTIKLIFIGKERGCFYKNTFYVTTNIFDDVKRMKHLLLSIQEFLGVNSKTEEVDRQLALNWSPKQQGDYLFLLGVLLDNLDYSNFVEEFLSIPAQRHIVENWHESILRGHLNDSMMFKLQKKIGDYLAQCPKVTGESN